MDPGLSPQFTPYRQTAMRREADEARLASQAHVGDRTNRHERRWRLDIATLARRTAFRIGVTGAGFVAPGRHHPHGGAHPA